METPRCGSGAPESWNQPGTRRAPVLRELAGLTIKRLQDRQNIDLRIVDRFQDFTVALVLAINKAMKRLFEPLAEIAVVVRTD